jgi:NADPH:quinone reductase-like Zn-dependent oxidoreductase
LFLVSDIKGGKGPASSLFLSNEIPKPVPGAGQVLVRVKYFGINRMDLTQRAGLYQVPPQAGPILGVEFSGVIEELGDRSVTGSDESFKVGDDVFGLAYGGTFTYPTNLPKSVSLILVSGAYVEYVSVSTLMLIHKPQEIPWEVAAGIPEVWVTATQAMELIGGFSAGKSILWHAGASSVSIAGIQLSKALGASAIYATAGSQEKVDLCKSLGTTEAWNYRATNWEKEVKAITNGQGVDIIIDFVGQDYFQMNLNSAATDGRVVIVGMLSGAKISQKEVDLSPFVTKRLRVEGSRLRSRDLAYQRVLRDLLVKDVVPRFLNGTFKVLVEKVFDWHEIQAAHTLMESNTIKVKLICKVT